MIETKIIFTEAYEDALDKIEDFIFYSSQEIAVLEWFWNGFGMNKIMRCNSLSKTHRYPQYIRQLEINPGLSPMGVTVYFSNISPMPKAMLSI